MKAKEFGTKYHLVKIYFKDQKGRERQHTEWYIKEEIANLIVKYYEEKIGEYYEDCNICGTIVDVFTFTAKQCEFED